MLKSNPPVMIILTALVLTTMGGCLGSAELDDSSDSHNTHADSNNQDSSQKGPSPKKSEPAPEPEPDAQTGSIAGEIVDSAFEPIPGATARLYNQTKTLTNTSSDDEGKFTINKVLPGKYQIEFDSECCRSSIESVEVKSGETTTTTVVLEFWASEEPYVAGDEWNGFASCFFPPLYSCSPDPNHDTTHEVEVSEGIETLLVHMEWTEGTAEGINAEECYSLKMSVRPNDEFNNGWLYTPDACLSPPIQFRLDAGAMGDLPGNSGSYDFENITDTMRLYFQLSTSSTNIVLQQPFTVHWEEHYFEPAPEDANAAPGAE